MTETARGRAEVIVVGLVGVYLAAIVAANLSVAHWGPNAAIYNAFVFIGLDLTCRDRLHDLWHGRLLRNMAVLIAAGSLLSYLAGLWIGSGPSVGRIALASTKYKLGVEARGAVRWAKERGKWVHMGRVNTQRRLMYANAIGCDSVDGSSLSRFRDTYLNKFLAHAAAPPQLMLETRG